MGENKTRADFEAESDVTSFRSEALEDTNIVVCMEDTTEEDVNASSNEEL